jgi:hypothetical protein
MGGYKYDIVLPDSDPRMVALATPSTSCNLQTCPLVREGAPHQQTRNCMTIIIVCSWALDRCLTARQSGRLTVGRNMTLTDCRMPTCKIVNILVDDTYYWFWLLHTWLSWWWPAAVINDKAVLSSERASDMNKPVSDSNKNLVLCPRWRLDTKTIWPTDRQW